MTTFNLFSTSLKSVLITGGAGFIGSYFVRKFLKMGMQVHVLDNLSTGTMDNLPEHPNLSFYNGSILDNERLGDLPKVDFVIHLASIVGMKLAKKDADLTYLTATKGTENILKYTGNTPILLLSSSSIYGLIETDEKVKENTIITIDNLKKYDGGVLGYACGKWHMEQIALKSSNSGRSVLIIRPFNVVGPRQVAKYGMVLPSFIDAAIKNMPLKIYGDGTQYRCFSDARLFVDCIVKLIQIREVWTLGNNIFNIGSDEIVTIQSLAEKIIKLTQSSSKIIHVPFENVFPGQVDVMARRPDTSLVKPYISEIIWPSIEESISNFLSVTDIAK